MLKGRGGQHPLLWLVLGTLFVAGVGCRQHAQSASPTVQDYSGSWEYRYGDSPRLPDDGWRPATVIEDPPGRNGSNYLWLRTRLAGPPLRDPELFCIDIDQSYEAYLDGKLIQRFGAMSGRDFPGLPKVYLPLGPDYAGKMLTLRIYSSYAYIGIFGTPRLGERLELHLDLVYAGLPSLVMGILLACLGVVGMILFALRPKERVYLYYGGFALGIGIHIACRSLMREFLFDFGATWAYLELGCHAVGIAALCAFLGQIFASGAAQVLRRLGQFLICMFPVAFALVAMGKVPIWSLGHPLQIYTLVVIVCIIATAISAVRRGDTDGKVLSLGLLIGSVLIVAELAMLLGIVPRWRLMLTHYATSIFGVSMGILLAMRFMRIHRRLNNYSTVLQLSLSQARVLETGQHMQIALDEVLRLIGGDRALLLESSPQNTLTLLTGRNAQRETLNSPAQCQWDSTLVSDVQRAQQPSLVLRERNQLGAGMTANSDPAPRPERLSIVAAPLLARGELLGILYLESDAHCHIYVKEDVEILLGLCNQVALTLMTTRAVRLELEGALARRRLAEQDGLLQAAGRIAAGDLSSAIVVPESGELAPLANALDAMRKDLQVKFQKLSQSNTEIQKLNEELRRQIEHRSHRLMEVVLRADRQASSPANQVVPGRMLGEHYKVLRTLGKGAMGSVFEVERVTDQSHLAAKVLSEQSDRTALLRFAREAQILARLDHPNLVAINDIDITATGVLFLVMELVRGTTLSLMRERYRDIPFATSVVYQIALGLHVIHSHGVVHRDLKPSNVLIAQVEGSEAPRVKLADFGVSTLMSMQEERNVPVTPQPAPAPVSGAGHLGEDATQESASSSDADQLTRTGMLIGTPMYMAPELHEGSQGARPSSDIFSLGVIAYELFAGVLPYSRPPVWARMQGREIIVPPLSSKRPELRPEILELVDGCLRLDPEQRPTAQTIAAALGAAAPPPVGRV